MTDPLLNPAPPRKRRMLRVAVQILGFAAGFASLGWCISMALRPENRAQFDKLAQAPWHLLGAMLAFSCATVVINGLLFWVGLLPVRRLRASDVVATNGLCSLLGYLPLKAGAVARVLIHNRRDGVPLLTIGAWFTSMLVPMAAAFGPPILAVFWLGTINGTWLAAVATIEVLGVASIVGCARLFRGQQGIERLTAMAAALRLPFIPALLRSNMWAKLHPGFDMLASPLAVGASAVLRLIDVCVHSGRFLVAAGILGVNLPLSQAMPISMTFFLIGVISPAGMAGLREGVATGLAGVLLAKAGASSDSFSAFAAVALLVTATEAIMYLAGGALGVAWLRPYKLLNLREAASTSPDPSDPPPT